MENIIYRCNVGKIVGTGHLMEILTLKKEMTARWNIGTILVINKHPEYIYRIEKAKFDKIIYLEEDEFNNINKEISVLKELKKKYNTKKIILDLFDRSAEYYENINAIFGQEIIILDSQKIEKISANVIINFSIFQDPNKYTNTKQTRYFIGPSYFMMDSLIQNWKPVAPPSKINNIFFNQGGSDPYNLTYKLLKQFLFEIDKWKDFEFQVVVGGALADKNLNKINSLKKTLPKNFCFHFNLPLKDMYKLMSKCNMAITAAGNTLYELCYFGLPSIVVGHHERHRLVGRAFEKYDSILHLGVGNQLKKNEFLISVKNLINDYQLRCKLSENARNLIDGLGLFRTIDIISQEYDFE